MKTERGIAVIAVKIQSVPLEIMEFMAKSIADKIDVGMIMLGTKDEDLVKLDPIISANPNFKIPNMKISVYKNRRGAYKGIYLWCYADLGICRIQPQFVTKFNFDLVPMEDIKINVVDEPCAWK